MAARRCIGNTIREGRVALPYGWIGMVLPEQRKGRPPTGRPLLFAVFYVALQRIFHHQKGVAMHVMD